MLNPIRVTAVEGVQLSTPAIIDCPTARALADWVRDGVRPVIGDTGGGVAVLQVAGSYACRPVNNQPNGSLSEHGRGRAIDISGFRMFDGTSLNVADAWAGGQARITLRKLQSIACGPFSTVLGPGSDAYHADHFHLDTANHRDGPRCD